MEKYQQPMLIHTVKAIRYRLTRAINGSNENFGDFKISEHTRSPNEIMNHMCDLATKTKVMIMHGNFDTQEPALLNFPGEKERLLNTLAELEHTLEACEMDIEISKRLLQGPLLDIATHIGQIAMLNGLHGNKIPKESYYDAVIV